MALVKHLRRRRRTNEPHDADGGRHLAGRPLMVGKRTRPSPRRRPVGPSRHAHHGSFGEGALVLPAYVAFLVDIHDTAGFSSYARAASLTYARYGGGIILRGPIVSTLEGDLRREGDTRLVVIEFRSAVKAAPRVGTSPELRPVNDATRLREPSVSTAPVESYCCMRQISTPTSRAGLEAG